MYSDLNAILLGEIVERVSREPLDRFVAREVCEPLGMAHTLFRPPAARRRAGIAPTGGVARPCRRRGRERPKRRAPRSSVAGHAGAVRRAAWTWRASPSSSSAGEPGPTAAPWCGGRRWTRLITWPRRHCGEPTPSAARSAGEGGADAGEAVPSAGHALRSPLDWPHRLDRDLVVDRSRPRPVRRAAHKSRVLRRARGVRSRG